MFKYYLRMAWISIRKTPGMAALMVGAIGIGIGVSMTMLTLFHMMSRDPIPERSDALYAVRVDAWDVEDIFNDDDPSQPPAQMTLIDASNIYAAHRAFRESPMYKSFGVVEPTAEGLRPETEIFRMTGSDFFTMFDVPFIYGGPWGRSADQAAEQVVVLSREYNDNYFGGEDSVGRELVLAGRSFRVVGVIDDWDPVPKFYDLQNGSFDDAEDIFIPFNLVHNMTLWSAGNNSCWGQSDPGWEGRKASECIWIQYWAELRDQSEVDDYLTFINGYTDEQRALGRMGRPNNNRVDDVNEWLHYWEVVDDDVSVALGLSVMFLAVCLFNTVGLLLAKFIGKSTETGIRRALGASRSDIFSQQLVEVGIIGLSGGALGLALAYGGLQGIRWLTELQDQLVTLDPEMVGAAFLIALISTLIAGLYPSWRVCRTAPASYLKAQ
jgi:putative ABC transport system permease protein